MISSYRFSKQDIKTDPNIYQKALEYSFDGIWIIRPDGVILFANDANERFYGYKGDFYIGKNVNDLIADGILKQTAALRSLQNNRECTLRLTYNNKDIYITSIPIYNEDGEIEFLISNTRDVTEIMHNETKSRDNTTLLNTEENPLCLKFNDSKRIREIVISSQEGRDLYKLLHKLSLYKNDVLILGESGTGKEVAARLLHSMSPNRDQPFVGINCTAIPETLLESELFGYEAQAYTGAQKSKPGIIEMAAGGTLLLDEIADMPLHTQAKLLRVIQEKQYMRVGGRKLLPVQARIISATNKNLEQLCEQGLFRYDLYYRLNVVSITVPPLRKRREDIPHIISNTLGMLNKRYNTSKIITPEVLRKLVIYDWPGNIRELENVIERMYITSDKLIDVDILPHEIYTYKERSQVNVKPLKDMVHKFEADIIQSTLQETNTLREAASKLGIDHTTLWRKMQRYNIVLPKHHI